MPFKLKQEITNTEIEIRNQTALLDAKKKEISTINASTTKTSAGTSN